MPDPGTGELRSAFRALTIACRPPPGGRPTPQLISTVCFPSVVTECLGDVSLDPDWEIVEAQSSSFSKKRAYVWTVSQEEMR